MVLLAIALIECVMGSRAHILGYMAFTTMPARGSVAIWQVFSVRPPTKPALHLLGIIVKATTGLAILEERQASE